MGRPAPPAPRPTPATGRPTTDLNVSTSGSATRSRPVGNLDEAEAAYRTALAIAQRAAETDPGNAEARRNLSVSKLRESPTR